MTAALAIAWSIGCGPTPPAEPPVVETHWDSMGAEQRLEHMRSAVTPRMKAVFMGFDRHRYPKFGCATCHGADGPERAWRMPNPDLLLEPTPWNTGAADPRGAPSSFDAFMASGVAPEMARLLGRKTFGCFGCHTPDT
jgi:mono/diheme cytochrome c family protein